jgi:hypothetical protein
LLNRVLSQRAVDDLQQVEVQWESSGPRSSARTMEAARKLGRCDRVKFLRALVRAFAGVGWVLSLPTGHLDVGFVVPPPGEPDVDPLTVPLTGCERETFEQLVSSGWHSQR